ncbi:unnamed protein product [Cuscuta europaea]|uniref:Uncharacterized protein n=1 Tax=Cuscuta europaea TaxID=41803 RepID=A0A9P0YXK9_CUSEU|nr:unnamed protein product [Cuscuta europaea]
MSGRSIFSRSVGRGGGGGRGECPPRRIYGEPIIEEYTSGEEEDDDEIIGQDNINDGRSLTPEGNHQESFGSAVGSDGTNGSSSVLETLITVQDISRLSFYYINKYYFFITNNNYFLY